VEATKTLALTEADVARQIGVSVAGLRKWRRQGTGPKFMRLGRLVRYSARELEAWLTAHSAAADDYKRITRRRRKHDDAEEE
jgi:predicted DNA-binding transcriptional regulator AlpA